MSNINSYDLDFLEKFNVKRAVLERHLTFEEIEEICKKSPVETEIFVHGALCYSFSGQCIFSSFLGGQSANRGRCTQPCRRNYLLNKSKTGFYFSPDDLSVAKKMEKFLNLNISSYKIEGRMKSAQYVGNVTRAYRILIDSFYEKGRLSESDILYANEFIKESYGRKTTLGYYFHDKKNIVEPKLAGATGIYIGKALETSDRFLKIKTRIKLRVGDRLRIQEIREGFKIKTLYTLNGKKILTASENSLLSIPFDKKIKVKKGNLIFKVASGENENIKPLKIKKIKTTHKKINLPDLNLKDSASGKSEYYLKLGDTGHILGIPDYFEDFLILPIPTKNTLKQTGSKLKTLKNRIIFDLPPFIFQNQLKDMELIVDGLINSGFDKFFLNAKSQIYFFQNHSLNNLFLIASERFHVANSYSALFLKKSGFQRWVSDIENNRENLNALKVKSRTIVMLYSKYPMLISRIPNGLKNNSILEDNKKKKFYFKIKKELFHIYSNETFNITGRINELRQMGYNKFLFDLSHFNTFKRGIKSFYNSIKYGKIKSINEFNYNFNLE